MHTQMNNYIDLQKVVSLYFSLQVSMYKMYILLYFLIFLYITIVSLFKLRVFIGRLSRNHEKKLIKRKFTTESFAVVEKLLSPNFTVKRKPFRKSQTLLSCDTVRRKIRMQSFTKLVTKNLKSAICQRNDTVYHRQGLRHSARISRCLCEMMLNFPTGLQFYAARLVSAPSTATELTQKLSPKLGKIHPKFRIHY